MVVLQEIQIEGPMTLHFPSWMSNSAHLEKGKKVWNNFCSEVVIGVTFAQKILASCLNFYETVEEKQLGHTMH